MNPYPTKAFGIDESLEMYEEHLRDLDDLIEMLEELKGVTQLGCWCDTKKCHGNVIIKLYKEIVVGEADFSAVKEEDDDEVSYVSEEISQT